MAKVKFAWGPGMNARKCNRVAAYHKETGFALKRASNELYARARRKLAAHHHSGDAEISLTHGKLDYFVNLDDKHRAGGPAAAAIEFGHVAKNGRFIEGAHALTGGLR